MAYRRRRQPELQSAETFVAPLVVPGLPVPSEPMERPQRPLPAQRRAPMAAQLRAAVAQPEVQPLEAAAQPEEQPVQLAQRVRCLRYPRG
jgi:hypothetical protein